jgi:hypothetical protein
MKKGMFRHVAFYVLGVLASTIQLASQEREEEPLISDRPDFTESAVSVPVGLWQLETGYSLSRRADETTHTLGEMLVRFGVLPRAELRFGLNSVAIVDRPGENASGLEDVSLGFKAELVDAQDGGDLPDLALLASASFPTGAEDIGSEDVEPNLTLAAEWDLAPRLALGSNLGWRYPTDEEGRFSDFLASVSLGFGATEVLGVYFEYFGTFPGGEERASENFLNAGLTLARDANLQLDGRIGVGLDGPEPAYFTGIGLVWRSR